MSGASVSAAWYTNLEQARPVNPSRTVIGAIADALCLDDVDRAYLFRLAGHISPSPAPAADLDTTVLCELVDATTTPAYCTDALTNVVAWNAPAAAVFGDYGAWPVDRRNLLLLLFEEHGFAENLVDRDDYAARVVRTFRGRSDAYLEDPVAIGFVDALHSRSAQFRNLWDRLDVRRAGTDFLDARLGTATLRFTMSSWQAVATPGVRFNAYLPVDAPTRSALEQLSVR